MLALPLYINFSSLVISRPNAKRVAEIYYPFEVFGSEIQFKDDTKIYVSPSIPQNLNMLGVDVSEIFSLFDVYFKVDSSPANFIFKATIDRHSGNLSYEDQMPYLMKANYSYAFLTTDDWASIQANPAAKAFLEHQYDLIPEPSGKLVLLVKKP